MISTLFEKCVLLWGVLDCGLGKAKHEVKLNDSV